MAVSVRHRLDGAPPGTGTWARFAVDDVWRNWSGRDLPPVVELRTGDGGGRFTAVNGRTPLSFALGTRYLVSAGFSSGTWPDDEPDDVLVFSACSGGAEELTSAVEARRPATAVRVADPAPTDPQPWPPGPPPSPVPFIVAAIGAMLATVLYRWRRRRSFDQPSVGVAM